MRDALADALLCYAEDPSFVFLTGDLGFGALEPLREAMGPRFINAGVAEQNMVGMAAGMAKAGMKVAVYSIAPFLYSRAHEQIRNDVCLHNLPVLLIGNGGGYGYGVMGPTHHALEDYGTLCALPNLRAFVPACCTHVAPLLAKWWSWQSPVYLRLGRCEMPATQIPKDYAPWQRLIVRYGKTQVICVGPIAGGVWDAMLKVDWLHRKDLWALSTLPVSYVPYEVREAESVVVVEEHIAQGSVGQMLAYRLGRPITHFCAKGYSSGTYGSQAFHREECGILPEQIMEAIR